MKDTNNNIDPHTLQAYSLPAPHPLTHITPIHPLLLPSEYRPLLGILLDKLEHFGEIRHRPYFQFGSVLEQNVEVAHIRHAKPAAHRRDGVDLRVDDLGLVVATYAARHADPAARELILDPDLPCDGPSKRDDPEDGKHGNGGNDHLSPRGLCGHKGGLGLEPGPLLLVLLDLPLLLHLSPLLQLSQATLLPLLAVLHASRFILPRVVLRRPLIAFTAVCCIFCHGHSGAAAAAALNALSCSRKQWRCGRAVSAEEGDGLICEQGHAWAVRGRGSGGQASYGAASLERDDEGKSRIDAREEDQQIDDAPR
mmetsp:Transcript_33029/g.95316  ORF Transcript_33029/g.95316 Transcript_33029/m.95316 type:complete len:310 (+) Transcript_33029:178-1107(+)